MLLTVHNLPPDIDYANIKRIIKELCFINVLLINLQEAENGNKKVTVSTVDANEAAIILKKLNDLEIEGYKLRVELGHDFEKERSPSPSYEEKRRLNTIYNQYIKQIGPLQVPSPPRISSPSVSSRKDANSPDYERRRRSNSKSPVRRRKSRSRSPHRRRRSSSRSRGNKSHRFRKSGSRSKTPCEKQVPKSSRRHRRSRSPGNRRKRSRSPRVRKIRSRSKSLHRQIRSSKSLSRSPPRNKRKSHRRRRNRNSPSESQGLDYDLSPPTRNVIINITASNDNEIDDVVSATGEENNSVIDESIIYAEFNETRILTEETAIVTTNNAKSKDEMVRDDFERNTELILNSIMNKPSLSNEATTVAVNNDIWKNKADPRLKNRHFNQNITNHETNIHSFEDVNTETEITTFKRNNSNKNVIVTSNVLYAHKTIESSKEQTKHIPNQTHRHDFRNIPLNQNLVRFPADFKINNYNTNFIDVPPFDGRYQTNNDVANNQIVPSRSVVRGNFINRHEIPPINTHHQFPNMNNSYHHNNYRYNIDPFNNYDGPPQDDMIAANRYDPRNNYMQVQRVTGPPILMDNKLNNHMRIIDNKPNRNQFMNVPSNSNIGIHHSTELDRLRGPVSNGPPQNYMQGPIQERVHYNEIGKSWNHEIRNQFIDSPSNPEPGPQMPRYNNFINRQGQEMFPPRGPLFNEAQFKDKKIKNNNNSTKDVPNKLVLDKAKQDSIKPNNSINSGTNEVTNNETIIKPNTDKACTDKSQTLVSNSVDNNESHKEQTANTQTEAIITNELDSEIAQNIKPKRKQPNFYERREKELNKYYEWREKQSDFFYVTDKKVFSSETEKIYIKNLRASCNKLTCIIIQSTPKTPTLNEYKILTDYIADKLHKLLKNKPDVANLNEYNILKEQLYDKLLKTMKRNAFLKTLYPIQEEYISYFLFEYKEENHRELMETYYKWCSEVFYLNEDDWDILEVIPRQKKKQRSRSKNQIIKWKNRKKVNRVSKTTNGQKIGNIRLESYPRRLKNKGDLNTDPISDHQETQDLQHIETMQTDTSADEMQTTESEAIHKEIDPQIPLFDQNISMDTESICMDHHFDNKIDTASINIAKTFDAKENAENGAPADNSIFESDIHTPDNILLTANRTLDKGTDSDQNTSSNVTDKAETSHTLVSNSVGNNESITKQIPDVPKKHTKTTITYELDSKIAQNIREKWKYPDFDEGKEKEFNKYHEWAAKQSDYFVCNIKDISSEAEKIYLRNLREASKKLNHIIIQSTPKTHPTLNEFYILTDYIADKLHKLLKNKPDVPNLNEYNILKEQLYDKLVKIIKPKFFKTLEPIQEEYISYFLYEYKEESHREFMETYYKWCSEVFYLNDEEYRYLQCVKKEKEAAELVLYRQRTYYNENARLTNETGVKTEVKKPRKRRGRPRNGGARIGCVKLPKYKRPIGDSRTLSEDPHTYEEDEEEYDLDHYETQNQQTFLERIPNFQENLETSNPDINTLIEGLDRQITQLPEVISEDLQNSRHTNIVMKVKPAKISHESQKRNVETGPPSNHQKRQESHLLESMGTDIHGDIAKTTVFKAFGKEINPKEPINQEKRSKHHIKKKISSENTPNIPMDDVMDTESINISENVNLKERTDDKASTVIIADNSIPKRVIRTSDNISLNTAIISPDKTINLDPTKNSDVTMASKYSKTEVASLNNKLDKNSDNIMREKAIDKEYNANPLNTNKISDTKKIVTSIADKIVYSEESISLKVMSDVEIKTEITDDVIEEQNALQHLEWPIKVETEEYTETFYQLQASDGIQMPKPFSE